MEGNLRVIFVFAEKKDGGDVADAVAVLIEDCGTAGARSPAGTDVEAEGAESFERFEVLRCGSVAPVEAVDDALGEVLPLAKGAAEAEGGVAGGDF